MRYIHHMPKYTTYECRLEQDGENEFSSISISGGPDAAAAAFVQDVCYDDSGTYIVIAKDAIGKKWRITVDISFEPTIDIHRMEEL